MLFYENSILLSCLGAKICVPVWHVKYLALDTQNGLSFGRNELEVSRKRNENFTFFHFAFAKYVLFIIIFFVFLGYFVFVAGRDIFFAAHVVVSFSFS